MMKRLKFVALGLMLIMVQSALAVTLPTTSYNPYISGSYSSDEASYGSGVLVKGSYLALGSGSDADICRSDYPDTPPEGKGNSCEDCCKEYVYDPISAEFLSSYENVLTITEITEEQSNVTVIGQVAYAYPSSANGEIDNFILQDTVTSSI